MVARPGEHRSNFNGAELSPNMHGRFDVKQFYSGVALMKNFEPVAQGGFRLAPRTRKHGRQRRALTTIATSAPVTGNFNGLSTVQTLTFALQTLSVVRLLEFDTSTADREAALQIEYQNAANAWIAFGAPFRIRRNSERTRAIALAPGQSVQAKGIRLRWLLSVGSTSVRTGGMVALAEGAGYGAVRHRAFTFSDTQVYVGVFSAFHVDWWREGVYVGCSWHNLDDTMLPSIDTAQRFDLMLAFSQDAASLRIMRDGADHEWPSDPIPFEEIAQVDYGGTYSKTGDTWEVYFRHPSGAPYDRILSFTVNGETTSGVEYVNGPGDAAADRANFLQAVSLALQALPSVRSLPSLLVKSVNATSLAFSIQFVGDDLGEEFVLSAQVISHTDSAATVAHTVVGKTGGEDLISSTRGYAAAGIFFQDRLVQGGFRSKKSALLAGVTTDYFNLNTEIEASSGALLYNLDTDGAERIQRFARSKHLLIFTSDAEYFNSDRAITRGQVPNIVECSRNGSAPTVPIVSNEGTLYYASKNRSVIYEAKYSDLETSYVSLPMSLLASHIVSEINDAALQRPEEQTDAARHWMVRDDGTMTVGVLIRNQEITGYHRWETAGAVKAICVDGKNVPYATIERVVAGQPVRFFESLTRSTFLDCITDFSFEDPQTEIGNLSDYEGAEVWAIADGYVVGPFTVEGGLIELARPASAVTVGRWTAPDLITLPLPRNVADRVVLARPIRVHSVRTELLSTTSIAIGANDEEPEDLPLVRTGDPVDQPPAPFTGAPDAVTGLTGFTERGQVRVTQKRPGWIHVRDLIIEARV